jgi:hypothetical protein
VKNEVCPCHSSQFVLASLYSRAPVRSQWRKVCRISVQTHPRIQTALANRQAAPNRQACRAMGTAPTRMSRTSIAVTTGIGITATGIGESGARAAPSWVPLGSMGRFRSERSIEHRVIRATTGGATPLSSLVYSVLRAAVPQSTAAHFLRFVVGMPAWNPDAASFVFIREAR